MAGNSKRQGAIRNTDAKKPRVVGSGGNRRQGLEGKGPTPKASERTGHVASRRATAADKAAAKTERARGGTRRAERNPADGELVVGRNPVVEALAARVPAKALHVQRFIDADPRIKQAMKSALEQGVEVKEVSRDQLDRLSDGVVHQGMALSVAAYEYADISDLLSIGAIRSPGLLVALDGVTDPRNFGAIIRSAVAFGGTGIVIPSRRSATVTSTAWRTSAGALAHIPVAMVTNVSRSIEQAQESDFTVIGLAGDAGTDIDSLNLGKQPVMLVIGGEGKGLGRLVAQRCDHLASISINPRVESLNAAVAGGIALHEVARSRAAQS
jgi:23S rRNA (guanosine2251-2'-O)-methyltransferase